MATIFMQRSQRISKFNIAFPEINSIALHRYKYRNQINTLEYIIYYVSKNVKLFCRMLKLFRIVLSKRDAMVLCLAAILKKSYELKI